MARPKKSDRPTGWYVKIPTSLNNAVRERLEDPVTRKPPFGSQSLLTEQLLRQWLRNETQRDILPTCRKLIEAWKLGGDPALMASYLDDLMTILGLHHQPLAPRPPPRVDLSDLLVEEEKEAP